MLRFLYKDSLESVPILADLSAIAGQDLIFDLYASMHSVTFYPHSDICGASKTADRFVSLALALALPLALPFSLSLSLSPSFALSLSRSLSFDQLSRSCARTHTHEFVCANKTRLIVVASLSAFSLVN